MEPFLGEIRMFAGNYAPQDWAVCDGRLLPISQYDALYSLLGTTYGGDGQSNFALPNLRGRLPVGVGTGTGLSPRILGQHGGTVAVTLQAGETPAHTHPLYASKTTAESNAPQGQALGTLSTGSMYLESGATGSRLVALDPLLAAGQGQSHTNMMPSLAVSFIICLSGIYPSQN
jgi:microcystin-dependent protein